MTKAELRKSLEQGMSLYIDGGKKITKCPTYSSKRPRKSLPKEETVETVEIEVDYLPQSLKARFFPEEN
jgi:hypothetical protein